MLGNLLLRTSTTEGEKGGRGFYMKGRIKEGGGVREIHSLRRKEEENKVCGTNKLFFFISFFSVQTQACGLKLSLCPVNCRRVCVLQQPDQTWRKEVSR